MTFFALLVTFSTRSFFNLLVWTEELMTFFGGVFETAQDPYFNSAELLLGATGPHVVTSPTLP